MCSAGRGSFLKAFAHDMHYDPVVFLGRGLRALGLSYLFTTVPQLLTGEKGGCGVSPGCSRPQAQMRRFGQTHNHLSEKATGCGEAHWPGVITRQETSGLRRSSGLLVYVRGV
ncbi:hypothetical protein NDU88_003751 [Pleurodeles waltl]|uniref:Uncharacterized protein n=1 Tax=Pleurodeles waltl TaxID=8319 RepID=A0AAV7UZC2_PLEWA|nr:hypothetical protein NDU88_003751 [Pleurodeles waltl]